jgi:hypothetical protein
MDLALRAAFVTPRARCRRGHLCLLIPLRGCPTAIARLSDTNLPTPTVSPAQTSLPDVMED